MCDCGQRALLFNTDHSCQKCFLDMKEDMKIISKSLLPWKVEAGGSGVHGQSQI